MSKNDNLPIPAGHCDGIPKTKPDNTINKELMFKLSNDYTVLPMFEKTMFEHKFVKHYSLQRHEFLKCRLKEYIDHSDKTNFAPFKFPNSRDMHFYANTVKFAPSQSVRDRDHRMKLKPGPMVDYRGQVPIPNELFKSDIDVKSKVEKQRTVNHNLKETAKNRVKLITEKNKMK